HQFREPPVERLLQPADERVECAAVEPRERGHERHEPPTGFGRLVPLHPVAEPVGHARLAIALRSGYQEGTKRTFTPTRRFTMSAPHVEFVEMTGHIVDSLLLPKVLDAILSRGGRYHIETLRLGQRQDDPSFARIEVKADSAEQLEDILRDI